MFDQMTDSFILDTLHAEPQRLDSIAEESENSEISLRSSNSNAELTNKIFFPPGVGKDLLANELQRNSIVVHMDMEQQPELDSSCDTGSFERNDGNIPNFEAPFSPQTHSPVNMDEPARKTSKEHPNVVTSQLSIQSRTSSSLYSPRSCSFDSAMSDQEGTLPRTLQLEDGSRHLNLESGSAAYKRPISPTPPDSRMSSGCRQPMIWSRDHSRDWHTSEDDSAQASIGTSPLTRRRELQQSLSTEPIDPGVNPIGSRSSTVDFDDDFEPSSLAEEGETNPEPTSVWRKQFFTEEKGEKEEETGKEEKEKEASSDTESRRGAQMSSLNWFHSTIEYEDENAENAQEVDQLDQPAHKCAPNLTIPYNPVPQDSMEIYSLEYPEIEHEEDCAYNKDLLGESQVDFFKIDGSTPKAPSSVASFDTVIEIDQSMTDNEYELRDEDGDAARDSRSLSRDSIKSIIENFTKSNSVDWSETSDDLKASKDCENGEVPDGEVRTRPDLVIPTIAVLCDGDDEMDFNEEGFISVRVQPPTPRATSPNADFVPKVKTFTVADELEAKMERQLANTILTDDSSKLDEKVNEETAEDMTGQVNTKQLTRIADLIAEDIVIDCLEDVTTHTLSSAQHSMGFKCNLDRFCAEFPEEKITRVHSLSHENVGGPDSNFEGRRRAESLGECCVELTENNPGQMKRHIEDHKKMDDASSDEGGDLDLGGELDGDLGYFNVALVEGETVNYQRLITAEDRIESSLESALTSLSDKSRESEIESALTSALGDISRSRISSSEGEQMFNDHVTLLESSEEPSEKVYSDYMGVPLHSGNSSSSEDDDDSVLSEKTCETNLPDETSDMDGFLAFLQEPHAQMDINSPAYAQSATETIPNSYRRFDSGDQGFEPFQTSAPVVDYFNTAGGAGGGAREQQSSPDEYAVLSSRVVNHFRDERESSLQLFTDMQETIFSNVSAGDESDEFKQQVGSPQEGFSIIKPDLDTELDIVNSCFALTESDREQKEDSEASFSTFLEQPHEGDKSTLLNILSESTPKVSKSQSVDGAKSSSHEELSSSKSFNDFCKPATPEVAEKSEPSQENRPDLQVFGFENPYFEVDFEKSDASDPSIRELKSERSTDSTEKMTDESTIGIFESQERKSSPERIQKQDTADQVPSQAFDEDGNLEYKII